MITYATTNLPLSLRPISGSTRVQACYDKAAQYYFEVFCNLLGNTQPYHFNQSLAEKSALHMLGFYLSQDLTNLEWTHDDHI